MDSLRELLANIMNNPLCSRATRREARDLASRLGMWSLVALGR